MEIRVRNVSKNYYSDGKKIEALADVDSIIPSNRIFTLLGPSGCGKTTLLRCIVGLESPDTGEIIIGARSYSRPSGTSSFRRTSGVWAWCSRPMPSGPT